MPSVKQGDGSVMVWGWFGAGKVGDLFRVKGTLNEEGYPSTLQRHAVPCGRRLVGDDVTQNPSSLCRTI